MKEYGVYVLYSESAKKLYIGYSESVINRFLSHNSLATKGYTIRYRPWKLIHVEYYVSKPEAMRREKQLKAGQGRKWIKNDVLNYMVRIGFISA